MSRLPHVPKRPPELEHLTDEAASAALGSSLREFYACRARAGCGSPVVETLILAQSADHGHVEGEDRAFPFYGHR